MDLQALIGSLPVELILIIVRLTSVQAAHSFSLANRFWRSKLLTLTAHPRILVVEHRELYRHVFMLRNGFAYQFQVSKFSDAHLRLRRGWFDLPDLNAFLRTFNDILRENTQTEPEQILTSLFMKVQPQESAASYYSMDTWPGYTVIDRNTFERITALIESAPFVAPQMVDGSADGISLYVQRCGGSASSKVDINVDGDVNVGVSTGTYSPKIEFQTRTSPALFQQLADIVVYSKHKQRLAALADEKDLKKFETVFNFQLVLNGKKYFVQEYKETGSAQLVTNGYKTGTLKKLMKVLEPLFIGKPDKYCLNAGQVTSAPPAFSGYQLIRLPCFTLPPDPDLTAIVAIKLTMKLNRKYTLHMHGKVAREKIVALFREVDRTIDYNNTKRCVYALAVRGHQQIRAVEIYSLRSIKPITTLSARLLRMVWCYIRRNRD